MADWEANVRRVVPYTPGEQPKRNDIIKLNTNECPYPPAPGVTKALQEFEADKLRLYPDPAALELREAIAAAVSVSEHPVAADQVFVGVGSDDVLALAFLTFFNSKNRFCSRTSPIPFTTSGRICTAFPIGRLGWMKGSA